MLLLLTRACYAGCMQMIARKGPRKKSNFESDLLKNELINQFFLWDIFCSESLKECIKKISAIFHENALTQKLLEASVLSVILLDRWTEVLVRAAWPAPEWWG